MDDERFQELSEKALVKYISTRSSKHDIFVSALITGIVALLFGFIGFKLQYSIQLKEENSIYYKELVSSIILRQSVYEKEIQDFDKVISDLDEFTGYTDEEKERFSSGLIDSKDLLHKNIELLELRHDYLKVIFESGDELQKQELIDLELSILSADFQLNSALRIKEILGESMNHAKSFMEEQGKKIREIYNLILELENRLIFLKSLDYKYELDIDNVKHDIGQIDYLKLTSFLDETKQNTNELDEKLIELKKELLESSESLYFYKEADKFQLESIFLESEFIRSEASKRLNIETLPALILSLETE